MRWVALCTKKFPQATVGTWYVRTARPWAEVVKHTGKMLPDPNYSVSRKSSERPRKTGRTCPRSSSRNWRLICDDVLFLTSNGKLMQVFLYNKKSDVRIMGKPRHLKAKIPSPHFVSATHYISTMVLHRR